MAENATLLRLEDPCPKCGAEYEITVWIAEATSNKVRQHAVQFVPAQPDRSADQLVEAASVLPEPREHIRKTCGLCHASWAALPRDAEGKAP